MTPVEEGCTTGGVGVPPAVSKCVMAIQIAGETPALQNRRGRDHSIPPRLSPEMPSINGGTYDSGCGNILDRATGDHFKNKAQLVDDRGRQHEGIRIVKSHAAIDAIKGNREFGPSVDNRLGRLFSR